MEPHNKVLSGTQLDEKIKTLKEVKSDLANWETFYLDPSTNEKWVKQHPNSEMHGGGVPILKQIDCFPWE